jgi:flagellar hook assembly protein FlgD
VTPSANGLDATFQLARAADVTVTVEKANGIVLATLMSKKLEPGTQSMSWNGRPGAGSRVRVVAANSIGKATLIAPVTVRRS